MSQSVLEAPAAEQTTFAIDPAKLAARPANTRHDKIEHTTHAEAEALMVASLATGGDLVVVYGKTPCKDCDATIRSLIKNGVPFIKVDILKDQDALEYILSQGCQQAPYVRTARGDSWSAYRMDKLMEHRQGLAALAAA